jgi:hypothetical protein
MAMENRLTPRPPAKLSARTWGASFLLILGALMGGCQKPKEPPSEQLVQCLRDQHQLVALVAGLEPQLQALATIKKEAFIPPAKPTPIDPELAERYSQEDRELDEQRYQSSLVVWEQLHAERYRLWLTDHTRRERALELDVERQAKALKQLNPAVVQRSPNKPGSLALNRQAVEKYSHCDPQAF